MEEKNNNEYNAEMAINEYLSLLQIKYDRETVYSLVKSLQQDGITGFGIIPYFTLTAATILEMLRFLKKSLNEIATAFVPHVPISPILSSTVSAQHFFCGLSYFCNARTVCRLLHHDNFLSQHKKYGRLVLLFKVAVHSRRFKISF